MRTFYKSNALIVLGVLVVLEIGGAYAEWNLPRHGNNVEKLRTR
jgi:hypothetical protein